MKGEIDYVNDGVPPATLYEAQNAWYSLIDAAGSPAVRHVVLHARTCSYAWKHSEKGFKPQDTARGHEPNSS